MNISLNHQISVSKSIESILLEVAGLIKYSIRSQILNFLVRKTELIKRATVKKVIRLLDQTYLITVGSIKLSETFDEGTAKAELKDIRQFLNKFNTLIDTLNKVDYYGSKTLRDRTELCLSSFYELELALKRKSYKGNNAAADIFLKNAMADSTLKIVESLN